MADNDTVAMVAKEINPRTGKPYKASAIQRKNMRRGQRARWKARIAASRLKVKSASKSRALVPVKDDTATIKIVELGGEKALQITIPLRSSGALHLLTKYELRRLIDEELT